MNLFEMYEPVVDSVHAVKLTAENVIDVCATMNEDLDGLVTPVCVLVDGDLVVRALEFPGSTGQMRTQLGDWVTQSDAGYSTMTDAQFGATYGAEKVEPVAVDDSEADA